MTPEDFAAVMQTLVFIHSGDPEAFHSESDRAIIELLKELGYEEAMAIYEEEPKW